MSLPGNFQFNNPLDFGRGAPSREHKPYAGAKNIWVSVSAKIWAYDGLVYDVTDDIVDVNVTRNFNEPSSLSITIANQGDKYRSMFIPMDRIQVKLRRDQNEYIAFTGYLSRMPIYNLVTSQEINLQAECLIRRLHQKYWDASLPENMLAMSSPPVAEQAVTPDMTLALLMTAPEHVGLKPEDVMIQRFPESWAELAQEITMQNEHCLTDWQTLIQCPDASIDCSSSGGGGGSTKGCPDGATVGSILKDAGWPEDMIGEASSIVNCESTGNAGAANTTAAGIAAGGPIGLFQIVPTTAQEVDPEATGEKLKDPTYNANIAYKIYQNDGWRPWACKPGHKPEARDLPITGCKPDDTDEPSNVEGAESRPDEPNEFYQGSLNDFKTGYHPDKEMAFVEGASARAEGDTGCQRGGHQGNFRLEKHVCDAAEELEKKFGVTASTYKNHGTPNGFATSIDMLVANSWNTVASGSGKQKGDDIASFVRENWDSLNVKYMIWFRQMYWNSPDNPKTYRGGGIYGAPQGPSGHHEDHVHVTFKETGELGELTGGAGCGSGGDSTSDGSTGGDSPSSNEDGDNDSGGSSEVRAATESLRNAPKELTRMIENGRGIRGTPFRWGGGHNGETLREAKRTGVDAAGLLDVLRDSVELNTIGGIVEYFDYLEDKEEFDPQKRYRPGTILINPGTTRGGSRLGHMGMVIDKNRVLEANATGKVVSRYSVPRSHRGWAGYTHVGWMPDIIWPIEKKFVAEAEAARNDPHHYTVSANYDPFSTGEQLTIEESKLLAAMNVARRDNNLSEIKLSKNYNLCAKGHEFNPDSETLTISSDKSIDEIVTRVKPYLLDEDINTVGIDLTKQWTVEFGFDNSIEHTECHCASVFVEGKSKDDDVPQGWSLIENKRIGYRLNTSFAEEFRRAADKWGALNEIKIEEGSPVTVEVTDGNTEPLGIAHQDGRIVFDSKKMSEATQNARNASAMHELGHALGFNHASEPSVMNTPIYTDDSQNHEELTSYDKSKYAEVHGGENREEETTEDASGGSGGGDEEPCIMKNPLGVFNLGLMWSDSAANSIALRNMILNDGEWPWGNEEVQELTEHYGFDYAEAAFGNCEEVRNYEELSELYKEPYFDKIQEIAQSGMYTMQSLGTGEIVFWYPHIIQEVENYVLGELREQLEESEEEETQTLEEIDAQIEQKERDLRLLEDRAEMEEEQNSSAGGDLIQADVNKAKEDLKKLEERRERLEKEQKELRSEIELREELAGPPIDQTNGAILFKTIVVEDSELIDFHLNISDDPLVTHYYVLGDYRMEGAIQETTLEWPCWRWSTIRSNPLFRKRANEGVDFDPSAFIYRYGSRPKKETITGIKSPGYAQIWADHEFIKYWLACYQIELQVAYLPEAYPGQRIRIKSLGVECIIEQVNITAGSQWGTTLVCSTPLVIEDESKMPPLPFWSMISRKEAAESSQGQPGEPQTERNPAELGPYPDYQFAPLGSSKDLDADIKKKQEMDSSMVRSYLEQWARLRDNPEAMRKAEDLDEDLLETLPSLDPEFGYRQNQD